MAARPRRLAPARGARRLPARRAVVRGPRAPPRGEQRPPLRRRPAAHRPVPRGRCVPARAAAGLGGAARTTSRPTSPGSPSSGGACATGSAPTRPSSSTTPAPRSARAPATGSASTASAASTPPACRSSAPSAEQPRRPPVPQPRQPRAVAAAAGTPRTRDGVGTPTTPRGTPCWPACPATSASSSCGSRRRRTSRSTTTTPRGSRTTLLQRLQRDLRHDRVPTQQRRRRTAASRSTPATAAPARSRCCARSSSACSPTTRRLEPRDVLVMCPDVEAFAPLVVAAFGDDAHPAGRLRVSVADRSPRQTNPLLAVAATLLELAGSRVTGTQVLDLAGAEAVRRRFGFDDDDVEQLRAWTVGTRSALGPRRRAPRALADGRRRAGHLAHRPRPAAHRPRHRRRWSAARCPTTTSTPATSTSPAASPSCSTGSTRRSTRLQGRHPVDALARRAGDRASVELADVPLRRRVAAACSCGASSTTSGRRPRASTSHVGLADVVSLLERRLQGRPTSTSFRTGGLTVCTLTPDAQRPAPRRLPARPRRRRLPAHRASSTATTSSPATRTSASATRAARTGSCCSTPCAPRSETLVVTYSGSDPRTGAPLPPAVPLGELLDALDLTAQTADGGPARDDVVTVHPLQPFDAENFRPGRAHPLLRPERLRRCPRRGAGAAGRRRRVVGAPLPERRGRRRRAGRGCWRSGSTRPRGSCASGSTSRPASWDEEPDDALPVRARRAAGLEGRRPRAARPAARRLPGGGPRGGGRARASCRPGRSACRCCARSAHRVDAVVAAAAAVPAGRGADPRRRGRPRRAAPLLGSVAGVHGTRCCARRTRRSAPSSGCAPGSSCSR